MRRFSEGEIVMERLRRESDARHKINDGTGHTAHCAAGRDKQNSRSDLPVLPDFEVLGTPRIIQGRPGASRSVQKRPRASGSVIQECPGASGNVQERRGASRSVSKSRCAKGFRERPFQALGQEHSAKISYERTLR